MSHSVLGFYHYIIHISFNISVQLGLKTNLYCSCKSGSGALQPEGHPYKIVSAIWERGYPDLPACGPRRGSINGLVRPIFSVNNTRPSRGAKPREADDAKTSRG